jgi:hypothetical protein
VHIHPTQINPNVQLNELYETQKAAAKRETDKVRKKLLDAPAELEAESDSYVVKLGPREDSEQHAPPQNQPRNEPEKQTASEAPPKSISDWA